MSKFEINPFDRSALKDHKLLAGRVNEYKQVRFVLRNSQKQEKKFKHLLITGNRGVGKTSFLNLIEKDSSSHNIFPVRINLTESNSINSNEFFWLLFDRVITKLFKEGFFGGKLGPIDVAIQKIIFGETLPDPAEWVFKSPLIRKQYLNNSGSHVFDFSSFIDDINKLYSELTSSREGSRYDSFSKIVFIVDEAQHLYPKTKIIEEIRYIIQQQEIGVGFVFAGDNNFQNEKWQEVFGGSFRDFEILNLDYFDDFQSVQDYFIKSLESIGWTKNEIEDALFYRFKRACSRIFNLTSGKPAWINNIAEKMFERCMKGESQLMNFDRRAQEDVKSLLVESGEMDVSKVNFITNLSVKHQNWLSFLFSCEVSDFNSVYFFAKFLYSDSDYMNYEEFISYCKELVDKEILHLLYESKVKSESAIGYKQMATKDFGEMNYLAFGPQMDTTKQWLSINSNSKFTFSFSRPEAIFIRKIIGKLHNEQEENNVLLYGKMDLSDNQLKMDEIIKNLNNGNYEIDDLSTKLIRFLYKLFKRLIKSRFKTVFYAELINESADNKMAVIAYSFNDKEHINKLRGSEVFFNKLKSSVENNNEGEIEYNFKIQVTNLEDPDIERFQSLIIATKDSSKVSVLIDDKGIELIDLYINDGDHKSANSTAEFIYNLYTEGHEIHSSVLNNCAYVFMDNEIYNKAKELLIEAIRKIENDNLETKDKDTFNLIQYNFAILLFLENNFKVSLEKFLLLLEYIDENLDDLTDETKALKKLVLNKKGEAELMETVINEDSNEKITIAGYVNENIEILEKLLN